MNVHAKIFDRKMKKKYPDYEDNEYNYGYTKFIWGVKSWDDITSKDANLYTMNDLAIVYNRKSEEYELELETIYHFSDGRKGEIKYLDELLNKFTDFVIAENYVIPEDKLALWWIEDNEPWKADTISELYIKFKVFVNGYKSLFGE